MKSSYRKLGPNDDVLSDVNSLWILSQTFYQNVFRFSTTTNFRYSQMKMTDSIDDRLHIRPTFGIPTINISEVTLVRMGR